MSTCRRTKDGSVLADLILKFISIGLYLPTYPWRYLSLGRVLEWFPACVKYQLGILEHLSNICSFVARHSSLVEDGRNSF